MGEVFVILLCALGGWVCMFIGIVVFHIWFVWWMMKDIDHINMMRIVLDKWEAQMRARDG